MPSCSTIAAKRVLSSARSMMAMSRPGIGTPAASSARARPSGVWPPKATNARIGGEPSADSAAMTSSTLSPSSGSKYRRLDASKSVETVSGLELIMTAAMPWRRSTSAAWTAQ